MSVSESSCPKASPDKLTRHGAAQIINEYEITIKNAPLYSPLPRTLLRLYKPRPSSSLVKTTVNTFISYALAIPHPSFLQQNLPRNLLNAFINHPPLQLVFGTRSFSVDVTDTRDFLLVVGGGAENGAKSDTWCFPSRRHFLSFAFFLSDQVN